jgi:hypothetical protein
MQRDLRENHPEVAQSFQRRLEYGRAFVQILHFCELK